MPLLSYVRVGGRYPSEKGPERFPIKNVGNDGDGDGLPMNNVGNDEEEKISVGTGMNEEEASFSAFNMFAIHQILPARYS